MNLYIDVYTFFVISDNTHVLQSILLIGIQYLLFINPHTYHFVYMIGFVDIWFWLSSSAFFFSSFNFFYIS